MKVTEAQKKLLELSKRLTELESATETSPEAGSSAVIPVFFTEQFVFSENKLLGKLEKTIVNGAEDCYLTKVAYQSYLLAFSGTGNRLNALFPSEVENGFEFRWNLRLASTQSRYLSQANAVENLSRRSLGYTEVGLPLSFATPLYFAAGDAITIETESVLADLAAYEPPEGNAYGYLVYFTLFGYRNGEMA